MSVMKTNSVPVSVYAYEQQENDQGTDTSSDLMTISKAESCYLWYLGLQLND